MGLFKKYLLRLYKSLRTQVKTDNLKFINSVYCKIRLQEGKEFWNWNKYKTCV